MNWRKKTTAVAGCIIAMGIMIFTGQGQQMCAVSGSYDSHDAENQDTVYQAFGRQVVAGWKSNNGTVAKALPAAGNAEAESDSQAEVKRALEKLKKADSMRANVSVDLEMDIFGLELETLAFMDMISFRNPLKAKAITGLDLGFWGDTEVQTYVYEDSTGYKRLLQNKKGWITREVTAAEVTQYHGQKLMQTYLGQVTDIKAAGTQMLESGKAYKYTGVIDRDGLRTVLLDSGTLDTFVTLLKNNKLLKPLGSLLQSKKETIARMMDKAEAIPITLWIDVESGYPVRCTMDIAYAMNDSFEKLTAGDSSKTKLWSKLGVTKAELVIVCGEYNGARKFVLPEV